MRKKTYNRGVRLIYRTSFRWESFWGRKGKLYQIWRIFIGKAVIAEVDIKPESIILFKRF